MKSANLPPPAWKAYRDLFAAVQKAHKPEWSRAQLVTALNEDSERNNLPKCSYSKRSTEYWEADPKEDKRSSTPRGYRVEHLHKWLSEQISNANKASEYAVRLAAIAPPKASSQTAETVLEHVEPEQVYKFARLDEVMSAFRILLDEKTNVSLGIHDAEHPPSRYPISNEDALKKNKLPERSNSEYRIFLAREKRSYKNFLQLAQAEVKAGHLKAAGKLSDRFAYKKLSLASHIWQQYFTTMFYARSASFETVNILIFEKRFNAAISLLKEETECSLRRGDLLNAAWWQTFLAMSHMNISLQRAGQSAEKHRAQAITAYRSALKYIYPENFFIIDKALWEVAQHNLGIALEHAALRSDGEDAFKLLKESATAYRNAAQYSKAEDLARAKLALGLVLLRIEEHIYRFASIQQISSAQEDAEAVFKAGLKAIAKKNIPELRAKLHSSLGRALLIKVCSVLSYKDRWKKCRGDVIAILLKAQKVFESSLSYAKKNKEEKDYKWIHNCLSIIVGTLECIRKEA